MSPKKNLILYYPLKFIVSKYCWCRRSRSHYCQQNMEPTTLGHTQCRDRSQWPSDNTSQERKHFTRIASMDRAVKTRIESKNVAIFKTIFSTDTAMMFAAAWTISLATMVLTIFVTSSLTDAHSIVRSTTNSDASERNRTASRRVLSLILILFTTSWRSRPCLMASWETHFASVY